MSGDYHGWDECDGKWKFADVIGHPHNETVFVIDEFGDSTTPRQALSAIMSAMNQFRGRIQVVSNEQNGRLIQKLKDASLLKTASLTINDQEYVGILGVQTKPSAKKSPWWKFW